MLEERAVGGGAAFEEARVEILAAVVGVVVGDLVVVPGDEPGRGRVGGLQVGVRLVLRVALAGGEHLRLRDMVLAHVFPAPSSIR